ncbi:MAG: YfhO family protein [Flavobacteriaceae bacterium]|jgi:hypothetical protein|nr:YfhO family protein [Flavobacteriaceae bacterium]
MKKNKNLLPILGCLILFVILAFAYFTPLLSGKYISQPDIIHYKGGAHELVDYRSTYHTETYWTNSMFGGMPTYQMGAAFPSDIIKKIDSLLRFMPVPASYIFLLLGGFFLLGMVWLKNWKFALLGSVMFAFSTYFFIIISAGHNAKVHTIAYFAPFVAGVYLLYRRKYVWGFILSTLFLSLQIASNHVQMTYYLFLALGIFGLVELIHAVKSKEIKPFAISTGLFFISILLAVGMNASRLMATYEYSKETTRGKSELTINKKDTKKNGLESDYITQWSYGKWETLNLFIPNFMGGGNNEKDFKTTHIESAVQNGTVKSEEEFNKFQEVFNGSYWGEQPGTVGPAYEGAVVVFLAILALFFYRGRYKWWLVGATLLSFMLAWGKNFNFVTQFMIDWFPMYNKFRAVSSVLVIAEFTLPLLALLGIYAYFKDEKLDSQYKRKVLLITSGVVLAILLIFYLFGLNLFTFHTETEEKYITNYDLLEAIRQDRFQLFRSDILRTFGFVLATGAILFFAEKKRFKSEYVIFAVAALVLVDLWGVNKRYLNDSNFVDSQFYKNPFPTEVSETMMQKAQTDPTLAKIVQAAPVNYVLNIIKEKDDSHYRVFNLLLSPFNETNTSYFHQSVGGYHAAKLRRYQDIIDRYFSKNFNSEILNLLNTKYIISNDSAGIQVIPNPDNNGNAWFVNDVVFAQNPDEEITQLGKIDNKRQAVVDVQSAHDLKVQPATDTISIIQLTEYSPDKLTYKANSKAEKLAVFSEIYYPHGWTATIDGKNSQIFKVDYLLRGLVVPVGQHTIVFTFDPPVIRTGQTIVLITFAVFVLLSAGLLFWKYRKRRQPLVD